jgi:hypothetical protein
MMKTETFLKLTLSHSSLSLTYNRYENRHQLVRLVYQRLQLISAAKSCSFQQLQPAGRHQYLLQSKIARPNCVHPIEFTASGLY